MADGEVVSMMRGSAALGKGLIAMLTISLYCRMSWTWPMGSLLCAAWSMRAPSIMMKKGLSAALSVSRAASAISFRLGSSVALRSTS